jgi:hypothetical protein
MRNQRRAIALISVLLVSVVIFVLLMVGLGVTGKNVIFVSGVHQRNQALCAAESGVYQLFAKLESDSAFVGPLTGKLADGSAYEVSFVKVGNEITVTSTGKSGAAQKKLQATVALSADAFLGVSSEGLITGEGKNYLNAIRSIKDPVTERGNLHTNYNGNPAFDTIGKISTTGLLSAVGGINGNVNGNKKSNAPTKSLSKLDKSALLSGTFTNGMLPTNGFVNSNLRILTDLQADVPVVLADGAVIHVKGDVVLRAGVKGNGTIVSDGMMLVRGTSKPDMTNSKGVTLYSSQDLVIAHPKVTFDSDGTAHSSPDEVGDFFAGMPEDVPYILNQRLPVSAKTGAEFFTWYKDESNNPSSSFKTWRDGDGTELHPGLPGEVKDWLEASKDLETQIRQWAK